MDNSTVIGIVVVFLIGFIGFLINIYKQGKEQAETQYKLNNEINATISKLNIAVERLNHTIAYVNKELERLNNRATIHGKELDQVNMQINTLSTVQHQILQRLATLENKTCIGMQHSK